MTNLEILNALDSVPNQYFFGLSSYNIIQKYVLNVKTFSKIERVQQKNDFSQVRKWIEQIIQFMEPGNEQKQYQIALNLIDQNTKITHQQSKTAIKRTIKTSWKTGLSVVLAGAALFWASEEFL